MLPAVKTSVPCALSVTRHQYLVLLSVTSCWLLVTLGCNKEPGPYYTHCNKELAPCYTQ